MKSHYFLQIVGMIALALFIGVKTTLNSWGGVIYFYPGEDKREPAGIKRIYDLSNLEGYALNLASKKRLLSAAKILRESDSLGIELGHFVTKGENNTKDFACKTFESVEMKFQSSDLSVHGEPSTMIIDGPCQAKTDMNRIDAIWIPYGQIIQQKPGDVDLQFLGDRPVNVSFRNLGDSWPRQWDLTSVRLFNENGKVLNISETDVREILPQPLSLEWTRQPASQ